MRGSIHKKGDTYYVVFDHGRDPITNKRKQKWLKAGTTKKEAEKRFAELAKEINSGEYVEPSNMLLGEYMEKWLEQYALNNVRKSTYESYVWAVRQHIIPALGSIPLEKLKPLHIQEMLNDRIKKLSAASVHKQYAILREAIDQAIKWQLCTINPCYAVTPPRREKYRGAVYTPEQLQTLIDAALDTKMYLPIALAATCGLRRGEICGLRWQDVNLEKSLLFIRHGLDWEDSKLTLRPVKPIPANAL